MLWLEYQLLPPFVLLPKVRTKQLSSCARVGNFCTSTIMENYSALLSSQEEALELPWELQPRHEFKV